MPEKTYIAIDLKSFYASVECAARGLNPLTTNLVVADESRTQKTICLAVSPALKTYHLPGRPRLFEVEERIREANLKRQYFAPDQTFQAESCDRWELLARPECAISYVVAPPRMAHYLQKSAQIYQIYLKYIAPEDIHVYSIDEVFIDATSYLHLYEKTAEELALMLIRDVLRTTGITATAGIGTNLYLAKIAMDIVAKRMPADEDGVRMAELDERGYREKLWEHRPLTSFWRVGKGYAAKLEQNGMFTMGDVARCSLENEELLYRLFGVNAELLIDHAWGWEPCTIADIQSYRPASSSICSGQVLQDPYDAEKARLVVREMADQLALDLVHRGQTADQLVLTVGFDKENLTDHAIAGEYHGEVVRDAYGRRIPKHAHGTENLGGHTSSAQQLIDAAMRLYDRIIDRRLLVRRLTLEANHVISEQKTAAEEQFEQMDLFTAAASKAAPEAADAEEPERERRRQEAMLRIKEKFGKNAILKGTSLEEGATAVSRNEQIGGHKA